MNHSECWDLLSPSLDGELDPERARLVDDHVSQCQECRARLDEMTSISRRIRSLDRLPMPEDLKASLREMAAGSTRRNDRRWGPLAYPWAAASLLAAGLLVIVGILSVRPEPVRVPSVATAEKAPAPARDLPAVGAQEGTAAGRKEEPSPEEPAAPPPSPPGRGTNHASRAPQQKTGDIPDDIARSRALLEAREKSRAPVKVDQPAGEAAGALSEKNRGHLRALGYVADEAAPKSAAPARAADAVMALKTEAFELRVPEGAYATTLTVSGDIVSFGPLRPQPGGRARSGVPPAVGWRIQTASVATGGEARTESAPALESDSGAGSQSAILEKQPQSPDPAHVLALRRGPGGRVDLLLHVDETGLIDAAHPVGAQPLGAEVAEAVARLLQGSRLVPYYARQPAGFPLEVILPPAEAQ